MYSTYLAIPFIDLTEENVFKLFLHVNIQNTPYRSNGLKESKEADKMVVN